MIIVTMINSKGNNLCAFILTIIVPDYSYSNLGILFSPAAAFLIFLA
jgi:hypothetical protein